MTGWIIGGIILYNLIGFLCVVIMLFLIISDINYDYEHDSNPNSVLFILTCTIFWIILIPSVIIYKLFHKIKGGKNNE